MDPDIVRVLSRATNVTIVSRFNYSIYSDAIIDRRDYSLSARQLVRCYVISFD